MNCDCCRISTGRSTAYPADGVLAKDNCRVVQLDSGIHYLQEDNAEVIGAIVKEWLIDLGIGSSPKHKVAS